MPKSPPPAPRTKAGRRTRAWPGADQAQKQLWTLVAAKPSTCDEGTNVRSVKSVLVTKREPTADGKYLEVHGAAAITETGPCEGSGSHAW